MKSRFFISMLLLCTIPLVTACVSGKALPEIPARFAHEVPYIAQHDSLSCGTTAAAMVIAFYKGADAVSLTSQQAWDLAGTDPQMARTLGNDMDGLQRLANKFNLKSELLQHISIHKLKSLLAEGVIPIVNIQYRFGSSQTHAIVLTGYDETKQCFLVNDPNNATIHQITFTDLNNRWYASLGTPRIIAFRSAFVIYPSHH